MQPVNYGSQLYPSCFDNLTTHGIVAEDVMGYITGTPSPYLQSYVAQRGGIPTMPGRILPDPLPPLTTPTTYPVNDVYQPNTPQPVQQPSTNDNKQSNVLPNIDKTQVKDKSGTIKKVALAVLLTGLAVLGIVKGKSVVRSIKAGNFGSATLNRWTANCGNFLKNAWSKVKTTFSNLSTNTWTKMKSGVINTAKKSWNFVKNVFIKIGDFCKNTWNKIFNRTQNP
jgi:hypothetical protein